MGLFNYFSPSKVALNAQDGRQDEETGTTSPKDVPLPLSPVIPPNAVAVSVSEEKPSKQPARRFSFKPLIVQKHNEEPKHTLSAIQEREKRENATLALSKRLAKPTRSNSDKRAKQWALLVRDLIVGPTAATPAISSAVAKAQMNKRLKSQLMEPKSANKIIAHLRQLSADTDGGKPSGPIHAVCLAYTDIEEHELRFSRLAADEKSVTVFSAMNSAPVEAISSLLSEMHVVDLVKSPDFGLGQPGDGSGILAGAIPTAETVIKGVEQITPQLMALGYATGRAIFPDHTGIYPPTDRMSVLTYWWGFEVVLPPPSLVYLENAHSTSGAVMNFLSALALIDDGVREILPFIRYISQFIDFEFKNIQAQDKGKGVVCAATWLVPPAMVPRPWDFTPPVPKPAPQPTAPEGKAEQPVKDETPSSDTPSSDPTPTLPSTPSQSAPVALTPSIPAILADVDAAAAPSAPAAESAPTAQASDVTSPTTSSS